MDTLAQDIRFALRSLVKSPAFAVVSTITLALAIGVNTSILSIVNAIVFAELPMADSDEVALVRGVNAELGIDQGTCIQRGVPEITPLLAGLRPYLPGSLDHGVHQSSRHLDASHISIDD